MDISTSEMAMNFRKGVQARFTRSGDAAPINWRRGLFRSWLLVSAAWIMAWAIYYILSAVTQALNTEGDFLAIPVVSFGPPIALLFCGLATRWAISGFRSDEKLEQGIIRRPDKKVVQLGQGDTDDYVS